MKPRILLINPWIFDFAAFNLWARPLGLLKVAEYVSAFDADLFFIDCADSFEPDQYGIGKYRTEVVQKPALLKNMPRYYKQYGMSADEFRARLMSDLPVDVVLMTSIMSYWYPGVQETVRIVKETAGDVPIVLGGIYPALYPDHASRNSGADYIYTGRLKDRLLSILDGFGITLLPARKPMPYYRLNLYTHYPFAPLLTSTGCPFHCSYCASRSLSPEYERRTVDDVVNEMQELSSMGVSDFAFYDDALLYDADHHIKPLLDAVIHLGLPVRLHAPNGLHARFIDDELARMMRAAGFSTIRLSLETVDRARQESTGGKVTLCDFEKSVDSLQKQGFTKEHIGAYLLYGLPGQELDEVEEGIRFLKSLHVRILLAEFSPIRGTACWDDLVSKAIIPCDLDPL
ncbi:MAG: B12-binding domain-containing radical SAM protein, partial [Betaproteobacteria bacterium]